MIEHRSWWRDLLPPLILHIPLVVDVGGFVVVFVVVVVAVDVEVDVVY